MSFDEMVRLDLRCSNSCSLSLDLSLLVRTVRVVLKGTGGGYYHKTIRGRDQVGGRLALLSAAAR